MRLTPVSTFFGIVALGLPFAVAAGWTLGAPDAPPPAMIVAPAGAGGLGSAPTRQRKPPETTATGWTPKSSRKSVAVVESVPPSPVPTVSVSVSHSPSPSASLSPTPSMEPPVPTPTQIETTPPDPTPSETAETWTPSPSGLGGVFRRS